MDFMPRKPRIEYPGAMYHVMSRGDRSEDIFLDDVDRQDFLSVSENGLAVVKMFARERRGSVPQSEVRDVRLVSRFFVENFVETPGRSGG
jgi:hypothetical protein